MMATFANLRQGSRAWVSVRKARVARLRFHPFLRDVGMLSGGAAIGHAFTLAAGPVLTHIYGPKDFGALALFTSFLNVMSVALALQYEVSIVSSRDEGEAAYLTFASLLLAFPVSTLAGGILWGLIHFTALGFGALPWYAPLLMTLALCLTGTFAALRYWCLREKRFAQVSQGLVFQSAGRAMFQTIFGAVRLHSAGLLLGETAGRCLGMSQMFRNAWPVLRRHITAFRWEELTDTLWRNRRFPLFSLPSSFLDTLSVSLTTPLLIRWYGVSVGGYYSLMWRGIALPTALVTAAVADTFHTRLATCARETPEQVMALFKRTSFLLLLFGCTPAAILWFWGVPLFRFVFGADWAFSGAIASVVAPWYLLDFVVSPVSRVVLVLKGQEMKLAWDVLCLTSLLTVFFLARYRGFEVMQTIRVLTVVNVALRLLYFAILVRTVSRFTKQHHLTSHVGSACEPAIRH